VSKKRGNGEGSIMKRKDGRWMARYTVHTAKGPKRKHIYGRTRQEVAEKLSKAVSDRVGGVVFDGDNETLGAYLQRWIDEVVRGTVKQSTLENYAYIARLHIIPELGRVRLRALKSRDVRRLYREKLDAGLSPRTVQIIHTVLRKACNKPCATTSFRATSATPSRLLGKQRKRCNHSLQSRPRDCSKTSARTA
jgi:integrase